MRIAMTKKLDTTFIQIVHPVCCGLDVHKKKISACLITVDEQGNEQSEVKEFGTFTNELLEMRKWLTDNNCPILAMVISDCYNSHPYCLINKSYHPWFFASRVILPTGR